jgi:CheY-like chemotaxis protein
MRPCFLVVDNQYPGSISTRKLVIETAQLNVITAYSTGEALSTLTRFPGVNGIVFDTDTPGMPCKQFIERVRELRSDVPIITVSPSGHDPCDGEEYHVSSYEPQALLDQLRHICGKEQKQAIKENEKSADN